MLATDDIAAALSLQLSTFLLCVRVIASANMLADVSPWTKLEWKGVDIMAQIISTTVSAGIVAVIATLTWRWKRKRDLRFEEDKQRQQESVKAAIESERTLAEACANCK